MPHVIEAETCVGCGDCKDICPVQAISQDGDTKKCKVDSALCVDCGACEGACRTGAIKAE